ncbi:hypothetical protein IWX49DRAFT_27076 [Phyllosticta citricarpa]|uniref:Uncharacterized protein n=2 Tax=Phyllosticta TaxID=121621 RepID=A0ABR1MKM5_9PEZI
MERRLAPSRTSTMRPRIFITISSTFPIKQKRTTFAPKRLVVHCTTRRRAGLRHVGVRGQTKSTVVGCCPLQQSPPNARTLSSRASRFGRAWLAQSSLLRSPSSSGRRTGSARAVRRQTGMPVVSSTRQERAMARSGQRHSPLFITTTYHHARCGGRGPQKSPAVRTAPAAAWWPTEASPGYSLPARTALYLRCPVPPCRPGRPPRALTPPASSPLVQGRRAGHGFDRCLDAFGRCSHCPSTLFTIRQKSRFCSGDWSWCCSK